MNSIAKQESSSSVLEELDRLPEIFKVFWQETESSIPNAYLNFYSMEDYFRVLNQPISNEYYAFTRVTPIPKFISSKFISIEKDYFVTIVTPIPINMTDIAHELCHYYLHGVLRYPFIWDYSDGRINDEHILSLRSVASRIYDIAVHPTIDAVLKERGLLFHGFYERMYSDFKEQIKVILTHYNKITGIAKIKMIIGIIEKFNRLPKHYISKIMKKHKDNIIFKKILEEMNSYPQYNVLTFNPQSAFDFINAFWDFLKLDREIIQLDILWDTNILLRR